MSPNWLSRARGSFQRAADSINRAVVNTDLNDKEACRILNSRIMRVSCILSILLIRYCGSHMHIKKMWLLDMLEISGKLTQVFFLLLVQLKYCCNISHLLVVLDLFCAVLHTV